MIPLLQTWVYVRFVHYESQYRVLPVESYQAELITAGDYAKLQDRSLNEVELSNGIKLSDRQPVWFEVILPNYKKVDEHGEHYVLVTTLGTAHYYYRWISDAFPLMMFIGIGLFFSYWDLRQRGLADSEVTQKDPS